ncbi:uncharacterized protein LOC127248874 [Andrographis paniculata]|uniref:uncharacterized protein LOC127248874 n=1 Tax=Andrographis paniculata TaxID=175694 RepID=UPI0021E837E9|nr:uncharacterized protein LOC127248874 [Andrographis paniculata]
MQRNYKENVKRNATALRFIQQAVGKPIYPRIFGIKKAKEAWEILKTEFQGSKKVITIKLQSLWRQFETLSMKENEMTKNLRTLTQFELMGTLEAYEQRMSNYNNQQLELAFQVKTHFQEFIATRKRGIFLQSSTRERARPKISEQG